MAINRFDEAAQANFINTYVPIPFEELSKAAASRQNKVDQGRQMLDEANAAAASIKAIPVNANEVASRS